MGNKLPNNPITRLIVISIVCITLFFFCIDLPLFIEKSMQFFFALSICSFILVGFMGVHILSKTKELKMSFIDFLFLLWGIYILIHSYLWSIETYYYHTLYLISGIIFCLSLSYLIRAKIVSFFQLYTVFIVLSAIQIGACLLQYVNVLDSDSKYFSVMGTFNNPNITAMYICLSTPYFINHILENKRRVVFISLLILSLLVLVLINSRSAYLGLLIIGAIYILKNEQLKKRFVNLKKGVKYALFITLIISLSILSKTLYSNKQDSADGRMFIWKVTTEMIKENPLKGSGYGYFEKDYNLFQSKYIATNSISENERKNARYTYMPYNDFIEQAIEGGIIGAFVYLTLVVVLIYKAIRQGKVEIISILAAGITMSCVNFAIQAIPMWMLLLTASAQVSANDKSLFVFRKRFVVQTFSILLISLSFYLIYKQIQKAQAQNYLLMAKESLSKKDVKSTKLLLDKSAPHISTFATFYYIQGHTSVRQGNYSEALSSFNHALKYNSTPETYTDMAVCKMRLNNFLSAEQDLLLAINMVPANFRPRYYLLQLYSRPSKTHFT